MAGFNRIEHNTPKRYFFLDAFLNIIKVSFIENELLEFYQ